MTASAGTADARVMISALMELMVYPVIYFLWKGMKLQKSYQPTRSGDIHE